VPAFEKGELPPPEVQAVQLENGPDIYRQVDAGKVRGKMVLTA